MLGNLDAKRDWGYAPEYCEGMWMMLQKDQPDDYVLATGNTNSVRKFVELTFEKLGISIDWQGQGENEVGINKKNGNVIVKVDKKYFRPTEVDLLVGDPSKAQKELGWEAKTDLENLVDLMVRSDFEKIKERGF